MRSRERGHGRSFATVAAALLLTTALAVPLAAQNLTVEPQTDTAGSAKGSRAAKGRTTAAPAAGLLTASPRPNPNAKMLVQADELVYDQENDRVSAVGRVQIYYDGTVLEADRVTHDRKTNRLNAVGNVRYQTKDGNVLYSDQMDMDADYREGFIQSLLIETPDNTRIVGARADRSDGNITVLQSAGYTACEPCKENPQKPPLWQVKAARVIHNERERVIHYEDASIEFFGFPIARLPYFWHPDPTVKRQTGFLLPTFFSNSRAGVGVNIPYFWALAPNYDVTVSVAPMTRQIGPLVSAEFRHKLVDGSYMIRASGIFQQDPRAFQDEADTRRGVISPGNRDFRGSIETAGQFRINRQWRWGWDATVLTDRYFLNDYKIASEEADSERVSRIYLTGQGERSYFDLSGMGFLAMGRLDHRDQQPLIHPILDHSYVVAQPVLGGELGFRTNAVSMTREAADIDFNNRTTPRVTFDSGPNAGRNVTYDRCLETPDPSKCLMRGLPGDYSRFSTELNWRRTITNPWGVVVKPFASARVDVATRDVELNQTQAVYSGGSIGRESMFRAMPAVGVEARWPFISVHSWGTQVIEPIGQIVARPDETHIGKFPNEDAQSLIFDDTNLFSIDKYSGYDRVEGGTRANVGVQYTANINRYGMVNVLFGQSYHLAGKNSFAYSGIVDSNGEQIGLGLQSGLENDVSDYVGRVYIQPAGNLSYIARARFDRENLDLRRLELEARATFDKVMLSTIYARYDAQPLIGYYDRRESIYQTAAYQFHNNWTVYGSARYNIRSNKFDLALIGLNYVDECFAASLSYVADYSNFTYTEPVHRIMLRVNLRTIGGTGVSTRVGSETTGD